MEPVLPNGLKRIIGICSILILISTFIVILVGTSLKNINRDIKSLGAFLSNSENIQANFEKSLILYTESTEETIKYLLKLRPNSEEKYINFISEIESIGEKLAIKLNLKSFEPILDKKAQKEKALHYQIMFFGKQSDLNDFLVEMEKLPYFIKVEEINYTNPENIDAESFKDGNITLKIKLYIK